MGKKKKKKQTNERTNTQSLRWKQTKIKSLALKWKYTCQQYIHEIHIVHVDVEKHKETCSYGCVFYGNAFHDTNNPLLKTDVAIATTYNSISKITHSSVHCTHIVQEGVHGVHCTYMYVHRYTCLSSFSLWLRFLQLPKLYLCFYANFQSFYLPAKRIRSSKQFYFIRLEGEEEEYI